MNVDSGGAVLTPGSVARVRREGVGPDQIEPATIDLCYKALLAEGGHFRLQSPAGWDAEPAGTLRWRVRPRRLAPERAARFVLRRITEKGDAQETTVNVPWQLDSRSTYEPVGNALPVRNKASALGVYVPRRDVFEETYSHMPGPLEQLLFDGLYSDIVFLAPDGKHDGGLCSGMARYSIARWQGDEPPPGSTEAAIPRIAMYHGRQLTDRALLAAVPWFVRGSPRAAFQAVRRDLLAKGHTDRALDIAVPKLWRRDVAQALVQEGHTVVPYRLLQDGPDYAALEVYDPNHPAALGTDKPRVIHFDLRHNRYWYGTLVPAGTRNVGMIAVRQRVYARKGTAILATIGSAFMKVGGRLSARRA